MKLPLPADVLFSVQCRYVAAQKKHTLQQRLKENEVVVQAVLTPMHKPLVTSGCACPCVLQK